MEVKLVSMTQPCLPEEIGVYHPEELITYCARVSNPSNQTNMDTAAKLLKYCYKNKHLSIFEMVDMTVEITTSRAISAQLLRHRSFVFQEFSQRYAAAQNFEYYDARQQDTKNRQNSTDTLPESVKEWFTDAQTMVMLQASKLYEEALRVGIAKESARFLLPLSTQTRLYMKGSVRSWIHYLEARLDPSTQLEHREVAEAIKKIFCEQFPIIGSFI